MLLCYTCMYCYVRLVYWFLCNCNNNIVRNSVCKSDLELVLMLVVTNPPGGATLFIFCFVMIIIIPQTKHKFAVSNSVH